MRETIPGRRRGGERLVDSSDAVTPGGPIDVLYVDADAGVREATRRAIQDRRDAISIASVAEVEAALDVATAETDCLLVDPIGLDGSVDRLLSRLSCPVIFYTPRDPSALDEDLLAAATTIVEKDAEDVRGEFLAEKIVGVTAPRTDRREHALEGALGDIERRAGADETTVLVDDEGAVVWSSAPLGDRLPGEQSEVSNLYEWVETALPETRRGRATVEHIRDGPTEPVTFGVATQPGHFLWTESQLPAAAGSLRLVQVREVTDQARREARERLLDLLVEFAQDGLYTLDAQGNIDFCNEAFASMLGYEQQEILGKHASAVLAPDELTRGQETVQRLVTDPDVDETTVSLRFVRRDGTERELSVHYSLLAGADGGYFGLMGVARDVTEQADRKRELERYKELFDNLVGNFPSGGVFLFDEDLQFVEAGGQDLAQLGLEPSDFIGKTPSEIFPTENARLLEAAYSDALEGTQRTFEDTYRGNDYSVKVLPIRNATDDIVAGMAVAQNVTDLRERERRLRETSERLELALEGSALGVWDWNIETGDVEFDERWTGMLGYDVDELTHRLETWDALVHPADLERAWEAIKRHFAGETDIYQCDHRLRAKSGDYRWIRDIGRVFERDEDGNPLRMVGIHQDITERKERQRELQELTERLELALEGAQLGVWDWNVETDEVTFDQRWAGMLGYDESELEQRFATWEERIHPDDLESALEAIESHFAGETEIFQSEQRLQTKSGEYRWVRSVGRVFERDEDGNPLRMVGIHQDITDQKERQRELEAQHDELETLTQIHVLIQDVIRALGSAVTREEIEEMVCRRLIESEYYEFAWIGERTAGKNHLTWKTGAGGNEEYHDIVSERSEAVKREEDPGMSAVETGEVQVIHDVANDDRMSHWREEALSRDFRSAAVVPLVHEGVVHSALLVYANRAEAFSDRALESFTVLGEMVGFAFTAVQNRHLLLHDRVVELEFRSNDRDIWLVAVAAAHDCRLEATGCIDVGDGFLQYVNVDGGEPVAVLETCLAAGPVTGGRVVRADGDGGRLELTVTHSYQPILLDVGARPTEIVADRGGLAITAEAPLDADPRTIHRTLSAEVDGLRLASKQERTREDDGSGDGRDVLDRLTERQVEILQAAYLAGYYAWPRDTTAEELADSLDISSPTLHQHLRRATLNLLESLLDT